MLSPDLFQCFRSVGEDWESEEILERGVWRPKSECVSVLRRRTE